MKDYYLKFAGEAEAKSVLLTGLEPMNVNKDGTKVTQIELNFSGVVDIIGTIYKPTGEIVKSGGMEYPERVPLDGWHVNLRGNLSEGQAALLAPYSVIPAQPVRVWA